MIRAFIQMYQADEFIVDIENKRDLDLQLENVDFGYVNLVRVIDIKGNDIRFNPKYVAYIKYSEVKEND